MVLGPHVFPFTPSTGSETDANIIIYIISGFHFIFLESDENDDIEKDNENNRNAAPEKPNNQKTKFRNRSVSVSDQRYTFLPPACHSPVAAR